VLVGMLEELKALEERLNYLQQEFQLAKERHEFLQQYDLYEEWKQLKKKRNELMKKMKKN
jgi:hypothetical protein